MKQSWFLLGLISLLFVFSCKDKTTIEDVDIDYGYDYFPLEVGKYWVYQVDSIVYDFGETGTVTNVSQSFVQEEIVDTLEDNLGRTAYRIRRSERATLDEPWVVKDIWMATLTEETAEKVEENLRFLKFPFPIQEDLVWDGTIFIDNTLFIPIAGEPIEIFKSWSSEIRGFGETVSLADQTYDDVITVSHADSENAIELREVTEQYAKGVGLITREMRILDTQCIIDCEGLPWEEKAEKGFILRQELIEYN